MQSRCHRGGNSAHGLRLIFGFYLYYVGHVYGPPASGARPRRGAHLAPRRKPRTLAGPAPPYLAPAAPQRREGPQRAPSGWPSSSWQQPLHRPAAHGARLAPRAPPVWPPSSWQQPLHWSDARGAPFARPRRASHPSAPH